MGKIENLISKLDTRSNLILNPTIKDLIKIGEPAVKPLIQALYSDSPNVRNAAAQALGHIKAKEAVRPLIKLLDDPDELVPQGAARALGMIEDTSAVEPLITALEHENLLVRERAALSLGQIGDERAIKPLIAAIREGLPWKKSQKPAAATNVDWGLWTMHHDESMRSQAAGSLIAIGSAAADDLIEALSDPNRYVRGYAVRCLVELGETRAIKPLKKLLDDEDEEVRKAATIALKRLRKAS